MDLDAVIERRQSKLLGRLRGESRVQLFLKGRDRAAMRQATRQAIAGMPSLQKRVTVDVDPLSML